MAVSESITRVCSVCGIEKPLQDFNRDKSKSLGRKTYCRPCHRDYAKKYAEPRRGEYKQRASLWYQENKDRKQEYDKVYRLQYAKANREAMLAKVNWRRRRLRSAMPAWADRKKLKQFYLLAQRLTTLTGVVYEVDHIVPILGDNVCGLHCEFNLRVIPASENRAKGNRWKP